VPRSSAYDLGAAPFPVRVLPVALEHVRTELLQPLRIDIRHGASEKPRGFDQLGGDEPLAGFPGPRTGVHPELDAAGTGVAAFRLVAHADVAEQPGEQCAVDGAIPLGALGIRRGCRPFHLAERGFKLSVDIAPLPHARDGKEVLAASLLELSVKQLPELEEGEKIRAFVGELRMAFVGGRRALERALARILHRERRGDDQQLLEAAFGARRDQHAADARVERQPGEFAAELRKLVAFIDGTELREQCIAVGDCARRRRIEEGKLLDVAQAEALCPQDYRREGRAQQLRIWECRTLLEVLFGIQANADALRNASAAPGALVRCRPGDRLDAQHLHLVAIAVSLYPGKTGIDDVPDARHRERGFRDVGGEYDAALASGPEYAVLIRGGKPRIQGKQLHSQMPAPQHFGSVADLALSGQEYQDVAIALAT